MKLLLASLAMVLVAFSGCFGGDSDSDGDGDTGGGPDATFTVTPASGPPGTEFTFDASATTGAKGFFWHFGDGVTAEGSVVKHTFDGGDGRFPVTLVAVDGKNRRGITLQNVDVGTGMNRAPTVTLTGDVLWVAPGSSITFSADASDPDNDTLAYYWTVGDASDAASGGGGGHDHGGDGGGHAHGAGTADDPCAMGMPECFGQGESFSRVFDTPGIWVYHCHPHPWMKGLVIVEEGGDAAPVTTEVDNFAYVDPVLRVGVGANVTWTNRDPLAHTVTEEAFHPGVPLAEEGTEVVWTPDATGDYTAFVMVRDGKNFVGGESFAAGEAFGTLTVRVSDEVPADSLQDTQSDTYNTPANPSTGLSDPSHFTYRYNFTGNTTAGVSWSSSVPGATSKMTLKIFAGTTPTGTAFRSVSQTGTSLAFAEELPAGDYTFQILLDEGAIVAWTFTLDVAFDVRPPSGDAHAHH